MNTTSVKPRAENVNAAILAQPTMVLRDLKFLSRPILENNKQPRKKRNITKTR